mgnify:CR=1 FL=1
MIVCAKKETYGYLKNDDPAALWAGGCYKIGPFQKKEAC